MSSRPQTAILEEFGNTPEGQEKLAQILSMIREGRPAVTLAERTAGDIAGIGQDDQQGGSP